MRTSVTILEQASLSGGSLIFFIASARLLGPQGFAEFVSYLVPAQIVHGVAVHWVLLPITTEQRFVRLEQVFEMMWVRIFTLIALSPVFALVYARIAVLKVNIVIFVIIVLCLTLALIMVDTLRYTAIRLGCGRQQAYASFSRWAVSLLILAMGYLFFYSGPNLAIGALVIGTISAIGLSAFFLSVQNNTENLTIENATVRRSVDGGALLAVGVSNAVFAFATSTALSRINLTAFGAMQVFRSLVNWAPVFVQYLETHYAAGLARRRAISFINRVWIGGFLTVGVCGLTVIWGVGDWLISMTVGSGYVRYKWLLSLTFVLVIIQAFTRSVNIQVRLMRAGGVLWAQAFVTLIGSAIAILLGYDILPGASVSLLICVMIAAASVQGIISSVVVIGPRSIR